MLGRVQRAQQKKRCGMEKSKPYLGSREQGELVRAPVSQGCGRAIPASC